MTRRPSPPQRRTRPKVSSRQAPVTGPRDSRDESDLDGAIARLVAAFPGAKVVTA
jgi:hypothetical protein